MINAPKVCKFASTNKLLLLLAFLSVGLPLTNTNKPLLLLGLFALVAIGLPLRVALSKVPLEKSLHTSLPVGEQ